ncbi:hypothetical protein D3C87_1959890 [compost metagenome]
MRGEGRWQFMGKGSAQGQCFQAAATVGRPGVRRNLDTRQAQAVVQSQPVCLQNPGGQTGDAGLGVGEGCEDRV